MTRNTYPWIGWVLALGLGLATISCEANSPCATNPIVPTPTGPSATQLLAVTLTYDSVATSNYVFTASATGGVGPYTFRWQLGDGTSQVVGNPVTHLFAQPGTYTVVVTVTDTLGNAARSGAEDGFVEISGEVSIACFADPTEGDSPLRVGFRAVIRNSTAPITYLWDFGDGKTASERIVSHTYHAGIGETKHFKATATASDSTTQLRCRTTISVVGSADNCPADSNKSDPGVCGCGIPDTDTDGDGTADCIDNCPADSNKVEPGFCGCGLPETTCIGCPAAGRATSRWVRSGTGLGNIQCRCPTTGEVLSWIPGFDDFCAAFGYSGIGASVTCYCQ